MACGCGRRRQEWEVVTPAGEVVFTSRDRSTAETVARHYPGSTVREKLPSHPDPDS
ncbi:hypothetical protein SUDANB37_05652 [Streptomyces sp. enrichment culture]